MPDKLTDSKKIAKWQKEKLGDKNYNEIQERAKHDSEIVKALESYIKDIGCAKCDFKDKYLLTVLKSALDLINRLQAENERLENSIIALVNYIDILGIDKTDTSFVQNAMELNAQIREELKAKAYKELIGFLENRLPDKMLVTQTGYGCAISEIKNYLKELECDK